MHLSADEFFTRLAKLFEENSTRTHGSVFLSQKRLTHGSGLEVFTGKKGQVDTLADLTRPTETEKAGEGAAAAATATTTTTTANTAATLPVLVRATNGDSRDKLKSKVKLATVVQPQDLDAFFARYADVCRSGMPRLKRRDRSAQKKKAKTKKRKTTAAAAGNTEGGAK